ncbi:MAG TPA: ABC transporter substrate-binding protein [Candidatus Binatia bacterium]|jgi:NitT/TauT family transport system substrate-binding protein|nr:ABC transporter substrate-binding protein [Candidatus Binatia bacterium]
MVAFRRLRVFYFGLMLVLSNVSLLYAGELALRKIRVGYPSHSASMYPIYATKETRAFEKYGLDGEMIYVQGVQLIHIHVAGQLDFGTVSGLVTLQASVGGADLVLLANSIDSHLLKLTTHPSISGPADLKGKSIAVTRFGSLTDLVVRPLLMSWGLDPKRDVTLVQIGTQRDIATAIQLKKVEAGVLSYPTSVYAEKLGMRTLYDFSESGVEIPTTSVSVSREYARKNRDLVLRFLKAYMEGTKRLLTDRELGIRALKKYGGIQDEELLASTYDLFTSKYIRKVPTITTKSVENALKLVAESIPKAKERKPSEFIDASFMEELEKIGFIKSLWP